MAWWLQRPAREDGSRSIAVAGGVDVESQTQLLLRCLDRRPTAVTAATGLDTTAAAGNDFGGYCSVSDEPVGRRTMDAASTTTKTQDDNDSDDDDDDQRRAADHHVA